MTKNNLKNSTVGYQRLEQVIGCKWSVAVLAAIDSGITRPGALERAIDGISAKVLAERLRKLTAYRLLDKQAFAEIPPRTEYYLTKKGRALLEILASIHALDSLE